MVEGKKVPFTTEEINDLFGLSNNPNNYLGQRIITKPTKGDLSKVLRVITWPDVS